MPVLFIHASCVPLIGALPNLSEQPALPARLTEGEAVAIKCGAKAEGADAAEGDGGGSSTVECEAKGQINGAKQTAAVRRKKGRKRVRKVGQHHRS
jgi:hypothetical protein